MIGASDQTPKSPPSRTSLQLVFCLQLQLEQERRHSQGQMVTEVAIDY